MRVAELAAVTMFIAGGLVWLCRANPAKAVIPIGLGLSGAIFGYVMGFIVGAFRYSLIDGSIIGYVTSALIGAGCGWVLGSVVGLAVARDLPPVATAQAWMLRGLAGAAILIGILATFFESSLVVPAGYGALTNLPEMRGVTIVDALLVALVFGIAAGWTRERSPEAADILDAAERRSARRDRVEVLRDLARLALVLGCLVLAILFNVVAHEPVGIDSRAFKQRENMLTVHSLTAAALAYHQQHGSFPPDLQTLLAFEGQVAPGSFVRSTRTTPRGQFCVRVGADIGGRAGPPFYSGLVGPNGGMSPGSEAC